MFARGVRNVNFLERLLRSNVLRPAARLFYFVLRPFFILNYVLESSNMRLPTPHEKRRQILQIALDYDIKIFVETGSYKGETCAYLSPHFDRLFTVEVQPELASLAQLRLEKCKNVVTAVGDSVAFLEGLCPRLEHPTLFWLDAHFSGGSTGWTRSACPTPRELQTILGNWQPGSIVLIDDARDFIGINFYPRPRTVAQIVRRVRPELSVRIFQDMFVVGDMSM